MLCQKQLRIQTKKHHTVGYSHTASFLLASSLNDLAKNLIESTSDDMISDFSVDGNFTLFELSLSITYRTMLYLHLQGENS